MNAFLVVLYKMNLSVNKKKVLLKGAKLIGIKTKNCIMNLIFLFNNLRVNRVLN